MSALAKIRSAGYAVSLVDGFIEISPAGNLTDDQRGYLRSHKSEIIAELEAEAANDSDHQLTDDQTQSITRWVCSLGGSEVIIAEELADVLEQCRNNPDALAYFMKRASIEPAKPAKPIGDTRKFCRQCQHHNTIQGRPGVIKCMLQDKIWIDDWPRHCGEFQANGLPIPDVGVRWSPDPIERTTKPIKPAET